MPSTPVSWRGIWWSFRWRGSQRLAHKRGPTLEVLATGFLGVAVRSYRSRPLALLASRPTTEVLGGMRANRKSRLPHRRPTTEVLGGMRRAASFGLGGAAPEPP